MTDLTILIAVIALALWPLAFLVLRIRHERKKRRDRLDRMTKEDLEDIGTEELGHLEMVGTVLYQLTRSMTPEQIKRSGYDTYFVDHTAGVFPQFASGTPWTAATIGVTGDVIADLSEDMSAEQKARKTYDNILRLCDDPDVTDVIRFLREREVVHYQRFGEALRLATEKMDQKNVYAVNPAFDRT